MEQLFADFPTHTKAQWLAQAQKDLKATDLTSALGWKTEEAGLTLMPFFTNEDLEGLAYLKSHANAAFNAQEAALAGEGRVWTFRQPIAVSDLREANAKALLLLAQNAHPHFDLSNFSGTFNASQLLDGILLPYCNVSFSLTLEQWKAVGSSVDPSDFHGAVTGWQSGNAADWHGATAHFPHIKGLPIFHESSAENISQRLGSLLYETQAVIQKIAEKSDNEALIHSIFMNMEWHWALGNNYFFHLAGLRSLRLLLQGMAKAYGISIDASLLSIAAQTALAQTANVEWNMISNTTQAMSAIIGGCNVLSIAPHNSQQGDSFAERMARNISNLLADESYLGKVADPAAGSFYLESLTNKFAAMGWEDFQGRL